jgi:hypothetical protein
MAGERSGKCGFSGKVRFFGIDVHLEFCEIAVAEGSKVSQVGRIASTPEAIREFALDLGGEDQVVLDASGSVMAIARILRESNVGRVIVSNAAQTRAISHARVKSDRFDAAMLARLLSAGTLSEVWVPDEATLALRRRVSATAISPSSPSPSNTTSQPSARHSHHDEGGHPHSRHRVTITSGPPPRTSTANGTTSRQGQARLLEDRPGRGSRDLAPQPIPAGERVRAANGPIASSMSLGCSDRISARDERPSRRPLQQVRLEGRRAACRRQCANHH